MPQVLTYVEIDLPRCSRVYGVAPCTAAVGVTGDAKCFNTISTCQDRANFSEETETIRFAQQTGFLPADIDCIPSIRAVDITPAVIAPGENLGQRASVKISFDDHPHSDTGPGGDRYLSDRDYDPWSQGTFWGKFRARHSFLRGRALRLIVGQVGQELVDMETRHYLIDVVSGPTAAGEFAITAKDVLKLADGDRAVAPLLSNGFLSSSLTNVATSATLSPSGIGNAEYAASGYLAIGGKEIVSFTRSGDTLTITRAQLGTTAQAHAAEDRVQQVLRYASQDVADIISDLFQTYAAVPSGYVPLAEWLDETNDFLGVLYTGTVCEPTSVASLISELMQQAALAIWWDDLTQKIRLQVLRNISVQAARYDDDNVLAGTLAIDEQADKRLSRVQIYYAQINPLRPLTDLDNYRSTAEIVDDDAEADYGSQQIRQITSRWIPALGRTVAETAARKLVARLRDPPRRCRFALPRHSGLVDPSLGMGCRLNAWPLQDATGARVDVPLQITQHKPSADRFELTGEEMLFTALPDAPVDRIIVIDTNTNNFDFRAAHDLLYPTPESGDVVVCRITAGVIVGSVSTSVPAFDVGSWPAGVTLTLILDGRIQGCGGNGGSAFSNSLPTAGSVGGTALYTRQAIDVEYGASSEIWSGGGGGGGALYRVFDPVLGWQYGYAGGGGGGAGTNGGTGGSGYVYPSGAAGTASAGGTGGGGGSGGTLRKGGDGGGPGLAGSAGYALGGSAAAGGAAGSAVDGNSYITVTSGSADIRGAEIN